MTLGHSPRISELVSFEDTMRHKFTILIGYITQYIDYLPREDDQKTQLYTVRCL
jgi:hypothetical protein